MQNIRLSLILVCALYSCSHSSRSFEKELENRLIEVTDRLTPTDSLVFIFQHETLLKNAMITSVDSRERISFNTLEKSKKLFLYISDIQCSTCIDQELKMINEFYESEDIALLCNYKSIRDVKLYLLMNKVKCSAYIVNSELSPLMARFTNPTYFKLSKENQPSSVFFASISTPNKSRAYHEIMSTLY